MWKSQLKTEIALYSTKSEYTGLSYDLCETIPIMELLNENNDNGIQTSLTKAKAQCRVFEDNSGAIGIYHIKKYQPLIKHLNNRIHHFRSYVDTTMDITTHPINTKYHPGGMFTKALNLELMTKILNITMGW